MEDAENCHTQCGHGHLYGTSDPEADGFGGWDVMVSHTGDSQLPRFNT